MIGPTDAGKTTRFNLLTKFLAPTAGQILFHQRAITSVAPAKIARQGITRSFQTSAVFPRLKVMKNARIGVQRSLGNSLHFWASKRTLLRLNGRAMALLAEVDLTEFAKTVTMELPSGREQALKITTTLGMEPELVLLKEPMQSIGHEDLRRVTEPIKKASAGRTILMVEHSMNVVSGICDPISVLRRGAMLAEGSYRKVSFNPQAMVA